MLFLLFFTYALLCIAYGNGISDISKAAMQNPDLFGGDMLVHLDDDRNVIPEQEKRWTGATVPFVIDQGLQNSRNLIYQAMENYHKTTCVKFVPRTNQQNYIHIFSGQGCYSHVGMTKGQQPLSLGDGCLFVGTIVHELGHALGFWHEQNRSDRDDYLDIYLENIESGLEFAFQKLRPDQNILITNFDYESIMIYGNDAFSKNGQDTMRAKNGYKLRNPFDKNGMTQSDIIRIKKMYKC